MKTVIIAKRILSQLIGDKRTLVMTIVVPIIVLTLVYFVLNSGSVEYKVGIINTTDSFNTELEKNNQVEIKTLDIKKDNIEQLMDDEKIIAAVDVKKSGDMKIYIDGTSMLDAKKIEGVIKSSRAEELKSDIKKKINIMIKNRYNCGNNEQRGCTPDFQEPQFQVEYIYGKEDASIFDNFGAALIGIIVFFFVYLLSGINFLIERTSGTLEKLLSTPIKRIEVIFGYVMGFSILALVQTVIITLFVVYCLGVTVKGNIAPVLLVNLLTAVTALTLGILLSTLAKSEFQLVQFVPVVILPQIFLCGIFNLGGGWKVAGYFVPLHYTVEGLKNVMLRGKTMGTIWTDCMVLILCAMAFMLLNSRLLKNHRTF